MRHIKTVSHRHGHTDLGNPSIETPSDDSSLCQVDTFFFDFGFNEVIISQWLLSKLSGGHEALKIVPKTSHDSNPTSSSLPPSSLLQRDLTSLLVLYPQVPHMIFPTAPSRAMSPSPCVWRWMRTTCPASLSGSPSLWCASTCSPPTSC